MPQQLEELPLFPLNTVMFPFATLRLNVFEARYRLMVQNCLEEDRPFGIVLIRSGEEVGAIADPYMVGTAVRIIQVEEYEDGRMDIQVQGERRFRIRELEEDTQPYLVGRVENLTEHPIEHTNEADQILTDTRDEFKLMIQNMLARQEFHVQVMLPPDPVVLSFTIANMLSNMFPLENLDKQRMLETTDTLERMEELLTLLRSQPKEPTFFKLRSRDMKEWMNPN